MMGYKMECIQNKSLGNSLIVWIWKRNVNKQANG